MRDIARLALCKMKMPTWSIDLPAVVSTTKASATAEQKEADIWRGTILLLFFEVHLSAFWPTDIKNRESRAVKI